MRLLILPFLVASAAAQLGPDYERPATATPPKYKGAVSWREGRPADTLPKGEWWRVFRDAKLNELMARATANNQQVKGAIARFDQARATARMARSDFFPVTTLPLSAERQRTSENMPSPFPLDGLRYDGPAYNAALDFSWELDLWGKLRRAAEGARADAAAAADQIHNLLLGVQAEVAVNYFKIRALDAEMRLAREAVGWRNEALKIASARVKAGAGNELEEAQAATEVANVEAQISGLQAERDQLENVIAILVGANAAGFRIGVNDNLLPAPPTVPAGVPSDVLERRPDVAAAERTLAAATARIGVAKAYFFPSIKLIGRGGFQSGDIDLLLEPASLMWNYGPSVSVPLFAGSKNIFNLQKSKAIHDVALADYRQAFLAGVADVETSLSAIRNFAAQAADLERARASAAKAAGLAKTRYEAGTSPYLDVIEANRTALATERASAQIRGQRMTATVSLIKAIGGGWDQTQTAVIPATTPDPAARSAPPEEQVGLFKKMKGLFSKKEKKAAPGGS